MRNFQTWLESQPQHVRWAVMCALIGTATIIVEGIFVLLGLWNWPILAITALFFFIGTMTFYSDEFWNGPGGD